jgi:uncharacterized protein (TIGR03435 family)
MHRNDRFRVVTALAACLIGLPLCAQTPPESPAFDSASVKLAPADAPMEGLTFMIGLGRQLPPNGLLTMTGPLAPFIVFAYDVQDEVEARAMRARLPDWAQREKYTIVARPSQARPTQDQLRIMMRSLLEERFALKAHRETRTGDVSTLVLARAASSGTQPPAEPGKPAPVYCGLELHQAGTGMFHVSMIDVSLPQACTLLGGLGGVLGGRGMDRVVDSTGLEGKWDITLDFLPERNGPSGDPAPGNDVGGPSFTAALERELGLRLKKGTGQIEDLVIDHIAEPTPD